MNLDALNLEALRPILPLPFAAKMGILAGTALLIVAIYYFAFLSDLLTKIDAADQRIAKQMEEIKNKSREVRKLPQLKAELKDLEKQLRVALNLLPAKAQIPELLESVSWRGKDAGLVFKSFQPGKEKVKAIYAEIPVNISVEGSFRELLAFLRAVGEMPRIVAINRLQIEASNTPGRLNVSGVMTTYRFIEQEKKGKKKAPRRKPRR